MAADFEMGSLRVEMRKRFCVWEVVAAARESGLGKGSSRAVMWFVIVATVEKAGGQLRRGVNWERS